jgi:nucleotide-binding universal stress UspA family protein
MAALSSVSFKIIATAIAFSPRAKLILKESALLAEKFGATLLLIHIGNENESNTNKLKQLLEECAVSKSNIKIIWKDGEIADSIISTCKEYNVDLLILGALEKENILKYYLLNSISRNVCRKVCCSVLLLTKPGKFNTLLQNILIELKENNTLQNTIDTGIYFKNIFTSAKIDFAIETATLSDYTQGHSIDLTDEEAFELKNKILKTGVNAIKNALLKTDFKNIPHELHLLKEKPGYAICKFAQQKNYNLIITNAPDYKLSILDRIFTHDIEYLLEKPPTNLLIIQNKKN